MHLPLIDPPKPARSARTRYAARLFGLCAAVTLFWMAVVYYQSHQTPIVYMIDTPVPKASPVKYVTVTTLETFYSGRQGVRYLATHQMPLTELYDELEKRTVEKYLEVVKKTQRRCGMMSMEESEKMFHPIEKAFADKYGLSIKQVKMIRREGYRLHSLSEK